MGRKAKDNFFKGPAKLEGSEKKITGQQQTAAANKANKELPRGKTLLTRIKEILNEKSLRTDGRYNFRFDDCAEAFVRAMEAGSFIHMKEFIDRQEGKVPQRIADADGNKIKLYVGVPLEGDEAP
jgi:hypothetical protein